MSHKCNLLYSAPQGGNILNLSAGSAEEVWASSPAGLFLIEGDQQKAISNLPFAQPGPILARDRLLLLAGLDGGLARSLNKGATWSWCATSGASQPVTCLLALDSFSIDGACLAGTAGEGILRSADSGRTWEFSNFGMHSFQVFTLVSASTGWREQVFAGTEDGVYMSPNGGRAWKASGLEGLVVLSLALHPEYPHQPVLWAGLEGAGLARSSDGGKTWFVPGGDMIGGATVNALLYLPGGKLVAGTSEQGILVSDDDGDHWQAADNAAETVFCLAQHGPVTGVAPEEALSKLWAGTYASGLSSSTDGGCSWKHHPLSARRFTSFVITKKGGPSLEIWMAGPGEGVWTPGSGALWSTYPLPGSTGDPLSLLSDQAGIWLGTSNGLYLLASEAGYFQPQFECKAGITTLSQSGSWRLAASPTNHIYLHASHKEGWQMITGPGGSGILITAALVKDELSIQHPYPTIWAVYSDDHGSQVSIWQGQKTGTSIPWRWQMSHTLPGPATSAWLTWGSPGSALLGMGDQLYALLPGQCQPITRFPAPFQSFAWLPNSQVYMAGVGYQIFTASTPTDWQALSTELSAPALAFSSDSVDQKTAYAFTSQGQVLLIQT